MILARDARKLAESHLRSLYMDEISKEVSKIAQSGKFSTSFDYAKIPLEAIIKRELESLGFKVTENRDVWSISW